MIKGEGWKTSLFYLPFFIIQVIINGDNEEDLLFAIKRYKGEQYGYDKKDNTKTISNT